MFFLELRFIIHEVWDIKVLTKLKVLLINLGKINKQQLRIILCCGVWLRNVQTYWIQLYKMHKLHV